MFVAILAVLDSAPAGRPLPRQRLGLAAVAKAERQADHGVGEGDLERDRRPRRAPAAAGPRLPAPGRRAPGAVQVVVERAHLAGPAGTTTRGAVAVPSGKPAPVTPDPGAATRRPSGYAGRPPTTATRQARRGDGGGHGLPWRRAAAGGGSRRCGCACPCRQGRPSHAGTDASPAGLRRRPARSPAGRGRQQCGACATVLAFHVLKSSSVTGVTVLDTALSNSMLTWPSPSAAATVADSNCSCAQVPPNVCFHSSRASAGAPDVPGPRLTAAS